MYPVIKRAFDLLAAVAGLLVVGIPMLVIAALIKRHDGGPVLYSGTRIGKGGTPFRMHKFRTMVMNADKIGGSSTPEDDPRITPVGKFLRRYKLDELPQLLNVLTGEMSLVGPRPQVAWAVEQYSPEERLVLSVPPGVTDPASLAFHNEGEILRGAADPDKAYMELIHPHKMRLSLEYVRNRSLRQDIQIILKTLGAIAGHR